MGDADGVADPAAAAAPTGDEVRGVVLGAKGAALEAALDKHILGGAGGRPAVDGGVGSEGWACAAAVVQHEGGVAHLVAEALGGLSDARDGDGSGYSPEDAARRVDAHRLAAKACDVLYMGVMGGTGDFMDHKAAVAVAHLPLGNLLAPEHPPHVAEAVAYCLTACASAAPEVVARMATAGVVDRAFRMLAAVHDNRQAMAAVLGFVAEVLADADCEASFLARDAKLLVLQAIARAGAAEAGDEEDPVGLRFARAATVILKHIAASAAAVGEADVMQLVTAEAMVRQMLRCAMSTDDAVMLAALEAMVLLAGNERQLADARGDGRGLLFAEAVLSHRDVPALFERHLSTATLVQADSSLEAAAAQASLHVLSLLVRALPCERPRHADELEREEEPAVVELLGDVVVTELTSLVAEIVACNDVLLIIKNQALKALNGSGAHGTETASQTLTAATDAHSGVAVLAGVVARGIAVLRMLSVTKAQSLDIYHVWEVPGIRRLLAHFELSQDTPDRATAVALRSVVRLIYLSLDDLLDVRHELHTQQLYIAPETLRDRGDITDAELNDMLCRDKDAEARLQKHLYDNATKIQKVWRGRAQRLDNAKMQTAQHKRELLSFVEMHEVARDTAVLREEHDKRFALQKMFEERRVLIVETERLAMTGVHGAEAELQQRLTLKRETILARQEEQKRRLAAAHQQKLQQLEDTQRAEVADIEREKADLLLLDPMDADLPKQREAAFHRETRLRQQHAKARLYLRGLFLDELEAIGIAFEEELTAFDTAAAASHDAQLLFIAEERDRGFGLAGRVWWAERGVCAEQMQAWELLAAQMSLLWTPSHWELLRARIARDEGAAYDAWGTAELQGREAAQRVDSVRTGRVLGVELVEDGCRGVAVLQEDADFRELLHMEALKRCGIEQRLLARVETAQRTPIEAAEHAAFCGVEVYRTYERTVWRAQALCREGFSLMVIQLKQFWEDEEEVRAKLEARFRDQQSNIADSSMAGHEIDARNAIVREEQAERAVVKKHFDAELFAKDIDRLLALVETQEATAREEVAWTHGRDLRDVKGVFFDEMAAVVLVEEARSREAIKREEATGTAATMADYRVRSTLLFESATRTGLEAEHHVALHAVLRVFAAESQHIAHALARVELYDQESAAREAVVDDEQETCARLVASQQQSNGERIALNDDETAARAVHVGEETQQLRAVHGEYVAATTALLTAALGVAHDASRAGEGAVETTARGVLDECHARGGVLRDEEAARCALAAAKTGDLLAVFAVLQQQVAYAENVARGYVKDRCDMGFMVIHNAWLLENSALMLAEERFRLLRAQHGPRMQVEAKEARDRLELYDAFCDTSGATSAFVHTHLARWASLAHAAYGEYVDVLLDYMCVQRELMGRPTLFDEILHRRVLQHSEYAERCIVARGDMEQDEYTHRVCVEFDEAHEREALREAAAHNHGTTTGYIAARAIQSAWRGRNARRETSDRAVAARRARRDATDASEAQATGFATALAQDWFHMLVLNVRAGARAASLREAAVRRSVRAAIAAREDARRRREEQQRLLEERLAAVAGECVDDMARRVVAVAAVCGAGLAAEACVRNAAVVTLQTFARARMCHTEYAARCDGLVRRVEARWAERDFAAQKIQEFRKSRKQIRDARQEKDRLAWGKQQKENEFIAAYILRRCAGGLRARLSVCAEYHRHRHAAATAVQQHARACLATTRCILRKRQHIRNINALHAAWLSVVATNIVHLRRRAEAALVAQRAVRGHLGRVRAKQMQAARDTREWRQMRVDAAVVVQRMWRGRLGRRRVAQMRRRVKAAVFEGMQESYRAAAARIQRTYRGAHARQQLVRVRGVLYRASTRIQCAWRQRLARRRMAAQRAYKAWELEEARKPPAATVIQTQWRMRLARQELRQRRHVRDEARRMVREATSRIAKVSIAAIARTRVRWSHRCAAKYTKRCATFWRICQARSDHAALQVRLAQQRVERQRHAAAVSIQRAYRAHYHRRMAAAYRITRFMRRVTPHVRTVRAAQTEVLKMRLLKLRKVERLESMERTSIVGDEAEAFRECHVRAHAVGVPTYMMMYTRAERAQLDAEIAEEARAAEAAQPRLPQRMAAEMFYHQRKARNDIIYEAVEALKVLVLAERAERERNWEAWTMHSVRQALANFFKEESMRRAAVRTEQIDARRLLRARIAKLQRIDRLKREKRRGSTDKLRAQLQSAPCEGVAAHGKTFPPPRRPQGSLPPIGGATMPSGAQPLPPIAPVHDADGAPVVPRHAFAKPCADETSTYTPGDGHMQRAVTPESVMRGEAGAGALGHADSLICLDASGQALGDTGCVTLLSRMRRVQQVLSLRLDDNNLGDDSVKALAELLTDNRSITSISLSNNARITDQGATCLINALKGNPVVRFIDTDATLISQSKKRMLGYLLSGNTPNPAKLVPASAVGHAGGKQALQPLRQARQSV